MYSYSSQVHLDKEVKVASHCVTFSLSDPCDSDFKTSCSHHHNETCDQCSALHHTLTEIELKTKDCDYPSDDERDEATYTVQSAMLAIQSWKCHILRDWNQDQARFDILDIIDDKTVLVVNDWAMKFLPQKYRESQSDWFGKRGISWHISVVYRRNKGVLEWQGFVHIIQSCSQDSPAVVAILQDVLRTLKKDNPSIKNAYLRQDNAGCYHSATTILSCPDISKSTGVHIRRLDFSDPQGGKGAADRLAATCKSHIRVHINEGNDVVNAKQLEEALLSHGGVNGVRVVSLQSIENSHETEQKIPNITKLNNFEFVAVEKVKVWRAYNIGSGKVTKVETKTSSLGKLCSFIYHIACFCDILFLSLFRFL